MTKAVDSEFSAYMPAEFWPYEGGMEIRDPSIIEVDDPYDEVACRISLREIVKHIVDEETHDPEYWPGVLWIGEELERLASACKDAAARWRVEAVPYENVEETETKLRAHIAVMER